MDTLLSHGVDCLSNLTDNNVVGVLGAILEKTDEAGIPVYGSEVEQVKLGCVGGAGLDYIQLGIQTGLMAAKVLTGEAACEDLPYETIENYGLYINSDAGRPSWASPFPTTSPRRPRSARNNICNIHYQGELFMKLVTYRLSGAEHVGALTADGKGVLPLPAADMNTLIETMTPADLRSAARGGRAGRCGPAVRCGAAGSHPPPPAGCGLPGHELPGPRGGIRPVQRRCLHQEQYSGGLLLQAGQRGREARRRHPPSRGPYGPAGL